MLSIRGMNLYDRLAQRHKADNKQAFTAIALGILSLIGLYFSVLNLFPNLKFVSMFIPFLAFLNPTFFCSQSAPNVMLTFEPISVTIVSIAMIVVGGLFLSIESQALKGNKIVLILTSICIILSIPEVVIIIINSIQVMIGWLNGLSTNGISANTLAVDVLVSSFIVICLTLISAVNKIIILFYAIIEQVTHVEIMKDQKAMNTNLVNQGINARVQQTQQHVIPQQNQMQQQQPVNQEQY